MKIQSFKVVGVRGFLTKEISFRDSVTFLIGINGSGKTTILDLMYGLLNPCLEKLLTISFKEITLVCEVEDDKVNSQSKNIQIVCKKQGDNVIIVYQDLENKKYCEYSLPNILSEDDDLCDWDRTYSELDIVFAKSEVYSKIRSLSTPVILNLNRYLSNMVELDSSLRIRRGLRNVPRQGRGSDIQRALLNVQELVYLTIRKTARQQSRLAEDFKNKVFEDMFKTPQNNDFNLPGNNPDNYSRVKDLRKTLFESESLDEETNKLTQKINQYLEGYEATLQEYTSYFKGKKIDPSKVNIDLFKKMIVYDMQYNKIMNIAEYAKQNMQEVRKLHEPLKRFENSINMFFKEGRKQIKVSGSGDILVLNHNKGAKVQDTIFNLSSGEKQLIILMACLSLSEDSKRSHVYVVDEPEISLHISWQEQFVDALLEASPNTQFILATHSPSIIAKNDRRTWCEDITMRQDGTRI